MKFDLKKYEDRAKIQEMKKYLMIPFGAGKRNCMERDLAKMAIKFILANLIEQFELKPTDRPNFMVAKFTYAVVHCDTKLRPLK